MKRRILENTFHYFVSQESGWVWDRLTYSYFHSIWFETKGNAYFIFEEQFNKSVDFFYNKILLITNFKFFLQVSQQLFDNLENPFLRQANHGPQGKRVEIESLLMFGHSILWSRTEESPSYLSQVNHASLYHENSSANVEEISSALNLLIKRFPATSSDLISDWLLTGVNCYETDIFVFVAIKRFGSCCFQVNSNIKSAQIPATLRPSYRTKDVSIVRITWISPQHSTFQTGIYHLDAL